VVVRSDPEGLRAQRQQFPSHLHHGGQGDCTVEGLAVDLVANELVFDAIRALECGAPATASMA